MSQRGGAASDETKAKIGRSCERNRTEPSKDEMQTDGRKAEGALSECKVRRSPAVGVVTAPHTTPHRRLLDLRSTDDE